ncbi:MAG: DMT family transporter [Acidimicrobiales bacterium]|nr:DMT family transporter [Acidimicrobiales bacterium]
MERRRRGWVFAAFGMLLVSTDSFWVRWSEEDSWTIAFWVAIFSLVLYSAMGVVTKEPTPVAAFRAAGWPLLAVAIGATVSQLAFITALTRTSVANVVVIVAAAPVLAALVGWVFLREPTSRRVWVAIVVTVVGVLVIVVRSLGDPTLDGVLFALLAILAFATNMNLWRRWPAMSRLVGLSTAAAFVAIVSLIAGVDFGIDGRALFAFVGMGLVFNPIGRLFHTHAPRYVPASEVAMFTPIETVAAPIWAWVGFSEVPEVWTVVGGVIVISGMLYGTLGRPTPDPVTA